MEINNFATPKVTNFDSAFFGKQDVLRFEVTMRNILLMDVFEAIQKLVHKFLNRDGNTLILSSGRLCLDLTVFYIKF